MAERPIFLPEFDDGEIRTETIQFEWFPGFSVQQKQRSIHSLHTAAARLNGWDPNYILEVSTKSHQRFGVRLSAFNLTLPRPDWFTDKHPDAPAELSVESVYQGSKVFAGNRGPYQQLYRASPREAKRYMSNNGLRDQAPVAFRFEHDDWPIESPQLARSFYNYIYLKSLLFAEHEHGVEIDKLESAVAFTDIEFNPQRSISCQARACALYVVLARQGLIHDALHDRATFFEALRELGAQPAGSRQMPMPLEVT